MWELPTRLDQMVDLYNLAMIVFLLVYLFLLRELMTAVKCYYICSNC